MLSRWEGPVRGKDICAHIFGRSQQLSLAHFDIMIRCRQGGVFILTKERSLEYKKAASAAYVSHHPAICIAVIYGPAAV
jgi:hypothetical protein